MNRRFIPAEYELSPDFKLPPPTPSRRQGQWFVALAGVSIVFVASRALMIRASR
jgi:hypothetical protein